MSELQKVVVISPAQIRKQRLQKKISIAQLARRIRETPDYVQALEEGRVQADTPMIYRLAKALKVDVSVFFDGEGGPRPVTSGVTRDVDLWFFNSVYLHERDFLWVARTLTDDRDSARDLVQEAYAQVLTGDRWRSIESAKAYVLQTVMNLGRNIIRRRNVVPMRPLLATEACSFADVSPDAFDVMSSREELARILEAIETMPAQRRKVLKMRKLQDIPLREVARQLGISLSAAETHLALGMATLTERLADADPRWVKTKPRNSRSSRAD
ncbi:sigma-70 family RNA polymerase sigma factor [Asticcacaulis sp. SL142]|uniref:sigma-70 family RNA polymerase sigma factor n=1 Tax=Asticcacaulis sp. SL142 TaxID=2995155 RepID=UPI00226D0741|nr:sigma-70 family RNA polymerase sigma factor [Asticcacaulis sp. SL142]WAC49792.1 sigma-70 family RNA polymerase sigma factor [Asticcacaulis sp. SL142]